MKKRIFFLLMISFLSLPKAFAQDDDLPPDPEEPEVPGTPIDKSLPLLLVAGVVYTWRKLLYKENLQKP